MRTPAPIIDASILSSDPDDGQPLATCLPAPSLVAPETIAAHPPLHRPIRRVVKRPPPPRQEHEAPPPAPPAKPVAPPPLVSVRDVAPGLVRGLLDAQVHRPNGDVVGRAVDAVVNGQGRPRDIVINLTGFMGVGDRKVSLPWSSIQFTPNVAAGTAPVKLVADAIKPTASSPSSGGSPTPAPGGMNVMDAGVRSRSGGDDDVGKVVDILLDRNAQPLAVVLNISDSLIHDKRLVAADWSAVHVVGSGNAMHLEIDLNNQQIEASPPYESGKPPRIVSPAAPPAVPPAPQVSPASASAEAAKKTPETSARAASASRKP